MKAYHEAWLASRPDRTREWLTERLADGFQIHHIDGDHNNDCPENLALIDGADHMKVHGNYELSRRLIDVRSKRRAQCRTTTDRLLSRLRGELVYRLRLRGYCWPDIERHLWSGRYPSGSNSIAIARRAAKRNGWQWPIKGFDRPQSSLPTLACIALYGRQDGPKPWERAA